MSLKKINTLIYFSYTLVVTGVIFIPISWGGSLFLTLIGIVLLLVNWLIPKNNFKLKNYISIFVLFLFGVSYYHKTKELIIKTNYKPQKIYIILNEKDAPSFYSIFKHQNTVNIDSNRIIRTSSNQQELNKLKIIVKDIEDNEINVAHSTIGYGCLNNFIEIKELYFHTRTVDSIEIKKLDVQIDSIVKYMCDNKK